MSHSVTTLRRYKAVFPPSYHKTLGKEAASAFIIDAANAVPILSSIKKKTVIFKQI